MSVPIGTPVPDYPWDAAEREAIRLWRYEEAILRATRAGTRYGLSMRCERGDHGCRNSGSTCLCRCHDRTLVLGRV